MFRVPRAGIQHVRRIETRLQPNHATTPSKQAFASFHTLRSAHAPARTYSRLSPLRVASPVRHNTTASSPATSATQAEPTSSWLRGWWSRSTTKDHAEKNPDDAEAQAAYYEELVKKGELLDVVNRAAMNKYALDEKGLVQVIKALVGTGLTEQYIDSIMSFYVTKLSQEKRQELAQAPVDPYLQQIWQQMSVQQQYMAGAVPAASAATTTASASTAAANETTDGVTPNAASTTPQQQAQVGIGAGIGAPGPLGAGPGAFALPPTFVNRMFTRTPDTSPIAVKIVPKKWAALGALLSPIYFVAICALGIVIWLKLLDGDEMRSLFAVPAHHGQAEHVETRFVDVRGCDEAKSELEEVVDYLKNPSAFTKIGAKLPKGVLLEGEPGTGKTLLARAVAGEAGVPFFYTTASSFDELYVGVGSSRIRSLFADAKKSAPCIIFIDEIDALRARQASRYSDGTLQMLLSEMDGFEKTEGIIVMAATNHPESLDKALVRPGRFDKRVAVPVPDVKGRKEILDLYLKKYKISADVDSLRLARATPGFTGADLSQLLNSAAIKAVVAKEDIISLKHIEETRDDILMGRMRKSGLIDPETRRATAFHEAGHAVVALYTEGAQPIHKATIIERGHALGFVSQLPEGDQKSKSRKQLNAELAVCMGGRVAEELVFGQQETSTGASSDLQSATRIAYNMVAKCGMGEKVGLIAYSDRDRMSPHLQKQIDQETKEILDERHKYATQLLTKHREQLNMVANYLLEKETVSGEELKQLVGLPPK